MIEMTLSEIADVVGGVVDGPTGGPRGGPRDTPIGAPTDGPRGASVRDVRVTGPAFLDSRAPVPGGLFAAFVGDRVDGHHYAAAAVEAGAAAVLGSRPVGVPSVLVDDPQAALGALARHVLASLPDLRVLAVTGSQGKTSTKDLLAAVLAADAPTVATYGSFNNELGLPLTVLRAGPETRFLLLEMGARGVGHLRTLCEVARPDVSVVLNVGKAHVGEFGSQAAIAQAKGELVEALADDGVAVLNADDPLVWAMRSRTSARVVGFGAGPDSAVRLGPVRLDADGRPSFTVTSLETGEGAEIALRLVGAHQALNAAAAVAAAVAVGIGPSDAAAALRGVEQLSRWRMEVSRRADGLTVLNDSYNANPDSMRAGLEALAAMGAGRGARTVAVLGEMRELGASSDDEHDAVGRLAVRLGIGRLLVVGEAARAMHGGALAEGASGEDAVFVTDNDEAVERLRDWLGGDEVVLVKASRGARLDEVAGALLEAVR